MGSVADLSFHCAVVEWPRISRFAMGRTDATDSIRSVKPETFLLHNPRSSRSTKIFIEYCPPGASSRRQESSSEWFQLPIVPG